VIYKDENDCIENSKLWYDSLSDIDKQKFLQSIGVNSIQLKMVDMFDRFIMNSNSPINKVGYNYDDCRLEITFKRDNGDIDTYQYCFVPMKYYTDLCMLSSGDYTKLMNYYNVNIKNKFHFIKV